MTTDQLAALSALGDRTRLTIFERLANRPYAVGELAEGLPVSRPAVSQHLRVLKDAGLVVDEAVGNRRIYAINPDGLSELRAELDRFWTSTLDAYKAAVEQPEEEVT
ncbi:MAG: metalloregulator ArsR/SmtB family transcription factor [Candidatus Dormiibacterota bacterium]